MKVGQKVRIIRDTPKHCFSEDQVVTHVQVLSEGYLLFKGEDGLEQELIPEEYKVIGDEIIPEETIEYYDQEPDKRFVVFGFEDGDLGGGVDSKESSFDSIEEVKEYLTPRKGSHFVDYTIYDRVVGKEVKWS